MDLESKAHSEPESEGESEEESEEEPDSYIDPGFESEDTLDSPMVEKHKPHVVLPLPPSAMKKPPLKGSLKTDSAETPSNNPKSIREWEHDLAKSKLETEVYRGALVSQIETTKKALTDAHTMSHVLITTKAALEESMATMVKEIHTQAEQIKSLKEMVDLSNEELELCHKMLDDRDTRLADTEIELDALERVHSDLMDARDMKISELEKDLEIYKKVFGDMLDEKDLLLVELEEELRSLQLMHGELVAVRDKEKQQNKLLESVFSQKRNSVIDYEAFEKAEQALEEEYGPVGVEQESRLDLLLTAMSSTEHEIEDLKTKIEASTMFDSTITMPTAADTGTTADSSILTEGDDASDAAMIQRLQQRIKELEQKNNIQEETI